MPAEKGHSGLATDGFENPSVKVVKRSLTRFADQPYGPKLFETLKNEFDLEVDRRGKYSAVNLVPVQE